MTIRRLLSLVFLISVKITLAQTLKPVPLSDVRLLESDFLKAQQADLRYILELDMDRLLAPYLHEAGLPAKVEYYGNWENTGLGGHVGGHYLSALAMMYASTGNQEVKQRLDYFIAELKRAQDANGDGYLGGIPDGKEMWKEISEGKIDVGRFGLNQKWVPLYNIHKIYAGLRDAWLHGNSETAKEMLIDLTDWMLDITRELSDEQIQRMLYSEHGGLNESFADVYEITGDEKYLKLARQFSDHEILDPLLKKQDDLTGRHANTQIPKVIGYKRIGQLAEDDSWNDASEFFWDNVVSKRSVSIGGNSVREHFHPIDDFSPMINSEQGPETCNTYNMLRLTKELFYENPESDYMDYYEKALYNHILSSIEPDRAGFVYFTPMRPGHYRVYSQPQTSFWCCVGSGLENHTKYGEMIYSKDESTLFVNLFIPSEVKWKEQNVVIKQINQFPYQAKTSFEIKTDQKKSFKLALRQPAWIAGEMMVKVNGKFFATYENEFGYNIIDRKWKNGDRVEVALPMSTSVEQMPDGSHFYSFSHGPIVLAAKTSQNDLEGLYADDSRGGHIANGPRYPLQDMPIIVGNADDLVNKIQPINKQTLTFSIGDLYGTAGGNLELIPFYRLHNSRYMVYWQCETQEEIDAIEAKLAEEEAKKQALEQATIDLIYPGEQQPESDHFVLSDRSNIGVHSGKHWRDAVGWFSYELRNKDQNAQKVRITYWGGDSGRSFKIYADQELIAEVTLDGRKGAQFYEEDYALPKNLGKTFRLKFEAEPNSVAGGIYGVRLLK